jgi:hypothetical protein
MAKGEANDGDTVAVAVVGEESFGLTGRVINVISPGDDLHAASITLLARPRRAGRVAGRGPTMNVRDLPDRVDPNGISIGKTSPIFHS